MKKLVSIAVWSLAAAAFALPAAAADDAKTGASAGNEGRAAAGATVGNTTRGDGTSPGDNSGPGKRTGDTQARHDNNPDDKATSTKPKRQTKRKSESDASSGASSSKY
jgi:hypothetical protein